MTDNEIIKALECCKKPVATGVCNICPIKDIRNKAQIDDKSCTTIMIENAIDLINRLQAENDNYSHNVKTLTAESLELKKEIERLYDNLKAVLSEREDHSEAIKEFAERLKAVYTSDKRYDRPNPHTLLIYLFANIDNLVKEMVGEG